MNRRVGDLEFRWSDFNKKYELVKWFSDENFENGEHCCVVAFYDLGSEGYDIRFVGDRPFRYDTVDRTVWCMLQYGQKICDAEFELETELKWPQ